MTDDFIAGLRADLLEAAGSLERQGRVGRATNRARPRAWAPAVTRAALAVAACVLVVVVTVAVFQPAPPQPGKLEIVATVRVGGVPADAVAAGGSLWVGDMNGGVTRVDPRSHRVVARIGTGGDVVGLTARGGELWVERAEARGATFLRVDPATGRIIARVPFRASAGRAEFAGGALWVDNVDRLTLDRLDPASGRVTASVREGHGVSRMAASTHAVWALGTNGTLTEIDPFTGRVVHRVPHVVPLAFSGDDASGPVVAADARGAWISDPGSGTVARVEDGRITRRFNVDFGANRLAVTDDALWVSYGGRPLGVASLDPRDGRAIAKVAIGAVPPKTFVAMGDDLWVIGIDGTARLVRV